MAAPAGGGLMGRRRPLAASWLLAICVAGAQATCAGQQEVPEGPTRAELVASIQEAAQVAEPMVRAEVVRLAAASDRPELDEVLRQAARDRDPLVQAAALEGQLRTERRIFDPLGVYEALVAGDEAQRRTAFDLVLRFGDPALRSQVIDRALRHNNAGFRRFAFRRVVSARDATVSVPPETLARIFDEEPALAAEVVELVRHNGQSGALEPVHRRLLSEDPEERLAALRILAITPSLDCWPALRWARAHGSQDEQRVAVLALARLGDDSAAEGLQEVLRAGDEALIPLALRALAGLPSADAARQVAAYRTDTRADVRQAAMRALLALNAPAEDLVAFIEDSDADIASSVSAALLQVDVGQLAARVCPELRLRQSPLALLRFLWMVSDERETSQLADACANQLQPLLTAQSADVRALAARLYFSAARPDPARYATNAIADPPEVLYAYLEASLRWNPADYEAIYRSLLDHNLVVVRVLAALGLLEWSSA